LAYNILGQEGAASIASALKTNSSLQVLYLDNTGLDDTSVAAIGTALQTSYGLRRLDLGSNNIGDEGAIALARGLEKNSSLRELILRDNHIGRDGIAAISRALEKNSTLQKIDLQDNKTCKEGAASIILTFRRSNPKALVSADYTESEKALFRKSREVNLHQVVPKVICEEIPDILFPQTVVYLSKKKQHVNKLFSILRERPDLLNVS
jgi:Ran GTPase-activating protein (RanGAP) involved in mRNA processing and transport